MARNGRYSDALLRLVKALNETGVRYALTGGAAVSYYGVPRSTMDIDVVVTTKLSRIQVDTILEKLSKHGFTANKDEIYRAMSGEEVKFQAFDDSTGFLRVDLFLEKSFSRVADRIDGLNVWFRTFEEFIAKKIQYGDMDEAKLLLQSRRQAIDKEKIARYLDPQQRSKLERLIKSAKSGG